MTAPNALILNDVTKTYGNVTAVNRVNLRLEPGEITAVMGPSGAGKTTLLRLISGMEKVSAGHIKSGATILSSSYKHARPETRKTGLVFQDYALFPHLNVAKNIAFGLYHLPKSERDKVVEAWIERLNLTHRKSAFPHHLSGGEQQRVAIARALAPNPIAILLDEPFSGLDPVLRDHARYNILSLIKESGTPALLVSHDPEEVLTYADKAAILDRGAVLQSDAPSTLYANPVSLKVANALGRAQAISVSNLPIAWQAQVGDHETVHLRPEAIQVCANSPVQLTVLKTKQIGGLAHVTLDLNGTSVTAYMFLSETPPTKIGVSLNPNAVLRFKDA